MPTAVDNAAFETAPVPLPDDLTAGILLPSQDAEVTALSGSSDFNAPEQASESERSLATAITNAQAEQSAELAFDLEESTQLGSEAIVSANLSDPITSDPITEGGYRYGDKVYLLTSSAQTWQASQAEAQRLGGNLVTVNDAAEEDWLRLVFGEDEGFWIGISDAAQEGTFTWASGEAVDYTNWAPGEPSDSLGDQDYGWMNFGLSKQWDDNYASSQMRGIVEIPLAQLVDSDRAGNLRLESNNIRVGEDRKTARVEVLREKGSDGRISINYRTISGSATANEDYLPQVGTLTFAAGETRKTIEIPLIGDQITEGDEQFAIALESPSGGATLLAPRTAQITLLDDDAPIIYEFRGNTYQLSAEAKSWGEVQAKALQAGGNLVTVNSAEEEQWLQQTFGTAEPFWIGLSDQFSEGRFEWASGQAFSYNNWALGQPNGAGADQDYALMNADSSSGSSWKEVEGRGSYRGIIEFGGDNTPPLEIATPPSVQPKAQTVVDSLNLPTAIDWIPNSDKMLIAQKGGSVRIVEDGELLDQPFIDLSPQVNELRGLLGIAVHPDFENNPYVYLAYAYDPPDTFAFEGLAGPDGAGNRASRLTRVTADAKTNFRTAVPGSEVVLLGKNSTWENFNPFVNSTEDLDEKPAGILPDGTNLQDFLNADSESHTIGDVRFGIDGALYVSNGDGTSYNQLDERTIRVQDVDNLSGKILRIDPITGEGLTDNPFYNGNPNANRSKVYQYGLRNPFRFAIDPKSGQPVVGDVGWTNWEEVNIAGPGANFGWPYYEGGNGENFQTVEYEELPAAQAFYRSGVKATPAALGLSHIEDGIDAIVMGDVYGADAYPEEYAGDIFINYLGAGTVRNISMSDSGEVERIDTFATGATFVVQIKTGPDGLLYFVDLDDGVVGKWVV